MNTVICMIRKASQALHAWAMATTSNALHPAILSVCDKAITTTPCRERRRPRVSNSAIFGVRASRVVLVRNLFAQCYSLARELSPVITALTQRLSPRGILESARHCRTRDCIHYMTIGSKFNPNPRTRDPPPSCISSHHLRSGNKATEASRKR